MSFWTEANLVLQPILKLAVNDWPLAASRTEIEKVRPFCLQVSEEEKAAHHAGLVGVLFSPSVVCTKDRLSRLFLLHARHVDPSRCGEDPTTAIRWTRYYTPDRRRALRPNYASRTRACLARGCQCIGGLSHSGCGYHEFQSGRSMWCPDHKQ